MYWCAACGNPEVIIEKDKEGYSLAKGLVGSAILGPVGALAGADGKDVTIFYCPKCGARLQKCMPEYEVSNILRLLKNAKTSAFAKSSLDKLKEKYPNMLWSEDLDQIWGKQSNQIKSEYNTNSSESDNSLDAARNKINNSDVFSGDVKRDIKDYLNRINAPVRYSEIKDSFQKSTYSEIAIINGILELIENGLIKCSGDYFALVRDLDEMIQLKKCGSDNRKKLEGELFNFKKELEESKRTVEQKEENEIIEALGYMYKLKLLSLKTKSRRINFLLEKDEEELITKTSHS